MFISCGQYELYRSPKNAYFSCLIGLYFLSFFYEHPVEYKFFSCCNTLSRIIWEMPLTLIWSSPFTRIISNKSMTDASSTNLYQCWERQSTWCWSSEWSWDNVSSQAEIKTYDFVFNISLNQISIFILNQIDLTISCLLIFAHMRYKHGQTNGLPIHLSLIFDPYL